MSLSLYDVAVPTYRQILGAQKGVLAKAEAYFKEKGVDPATIMAARLADDMQPFPFQVMQTINHSAGALSLPSAGISRGPRASTASRPCRRRWIAPWPM